MRLVTLPNYTKVLYVHFPLQVPKVFTITAEVSRSFVLTVQQWASQTKYPELVRLCSTASILQFCVCKTRIISALHFMRMWHRLITLWISKIMHTLTDGKKYLFGTGILEHSKWKDLNQKDKCTTICYIHPAQGKRWELLRKESMYDQACRERMVIYKCTHYWKTVLLLVFLHVYLCLKPYK